METGTETEMQIEMEIETNMQKDTEMDMETEADTEMETLYPFTQWKLVELTQTAFWEAQMGITRSTSPQNNGNLLLPFLGGD